MVDRQVKQNPEVRKLELFCLMSIL